MAERFIKMFAWDFSGKVANQLIGFIVSVVLARILSPEEFGLVGMSMVLISFSGVFSNLGLSSALIQRTDPTEEHYSSSFYLNFFTSVFVGIVIVLTAPLVATFFKNPEITVMIRVLALAVVINGLSVVQDARFRRNMNFKILSRIRVLAAVISGITGIIMAFAGFGVWSLILQVLISGMVSLILLWFYSDWIPKLILKIKAIKDLWKYSFNLFLSGIINAGYEQIDSTVIARIFSAEDLGLFSRAKSLNRFVIRYSSESVGAITFPFLSALKEQREKMLDLGLKAEILIAYISFGLLGWLYTVAQPLILILFGKKWEGTIEIFRLLCLSGFTYPISAATLGLLKAAGYSGTFLRVEIWKKIVGITGLIIGFSFGLKGYLISLIFTGIISLFLNMYFTGRAINLSVKHQLLSILPYLAIALISSAACYWIPVFSNSYLIFLSMITGLYVLLFTALNYMFGTAGHKLLIAQVNNILKGRIKSEEI